MKLNKIILLTALLSGGLAFSQGFKEKIAITKKYNNYSNCKCEVIGNFVYIERKITA